MNRLSTLLLLVCLWLSSVLAAQSPMVKNLTRNRLFAEPVTPACHAATLAEVTPGRLLAAWFGGNYEGAWDVGIWISEHRGEDWSPPVELVPPLVMDGDTLPCWNPVLFKSASDRLYLFYKVGNNPREWFGAMIVSQDDGRSWSQPKYLPEGFLGPVRNKPVELEAGTILCGSSTESPESNTWRVHVERYHEATDTWERVEVPNPAGHEIIQPTLLVHSADTVQMLCRSKHGKLVSSRSPDRGATWSAAQATGVVNSNSGIDGLSLGTDSFLLVNNPLPPGNHWSNGRNRLDVEFSTDGLHWEHLVDLEDHETGEFSYPAIVQAADGRVHILYTDDRKFIRHAVLELAPH